MDEQIRKKVFHIPKKGRHREKTDTLGNVLLKKKKKPDRKAGKVSSVPRYFH